MNKLIIAVALAIFFTMAHVLELHKDCDGKLCDSARISMTQGK